MLRKITPLLILFFGCLLFLPHSLRAQYDTIVHEGVKVIVPLKEKKSNSYLFICGGAQLPAWTKVPMTPEDPKNMILNGRMSVKSAGWFAGIGILKKTKSNFEIGLLGDYYRSSIPVAFSGQRSVSEWVFVQSDSSSLYTDVFANDINRVSEVLSFRASIRYKIPIGKLQLWGGIAPGTFSSRIYFDEKGSGTPKEYRETRFGMSYQAGFSFQTKDSKGADMLRFTFFADFSGPKVEERFISLFKPGWKFINTDKNYIVNPVRIGLAVGIH